VSACGKGTQRDGGVHVPVFLQLPALLHVSSPQQHPPPPACAAAALVRSNESDHVGRVAGSKDLGFQGFRVLCVH
jgi:hypothetical protein